MWIGVCQAGAAPKLSEEPCVGESGGLVIAESRRLLGVHDSNCFRNKFCFGELVRAPVHGCEGVAGGLYAEYNQLSRGASEGTWMTVVPASDDDLGGT